MPEIMCKTQNCPKSHLCYRFTATPSKDQVYSKFEFFYDDDFIRFDKAQCNFFILNVNKNINKNKTEVEMQC